MSQLAPATIESEPDKLVRLPKKQAKAAQMVAEDRLSDEKIAESCGINRRTLNRWKLKPDFAARVKVISEEYAERIKSVGISRREVRVAELHEMFKGLKQVIYERADQYGKKKAVDSSELVEKETESDTESGSGNDASVPGGSTGLVCRTQKVIGSGSSAKTIDEYVIDVPVVREMRAILQQTAEELGQKVERHEIDARVGFFVLNPVLVGGQKPLKKEGQDA